MTADQRRRLARVEDRAVGFVGPGDPDIGRRVRELLTALNVSVWPPWPPEHDGAYRTWVQTHWAANEPAGFDVVLIVEADGLDDDAATRLFNDPAACARLCRERGVLTAGRRLPHDE